MPKTAQFKDQNNISRRLGGLGGRLKLNEASWDQWFIHESQNFKQFKMDLKDGLLPANTPTNLQNNQNDKI